MFRKNFVFGVHSAEDGAFSVYAKDLYQPEKGYGFVTEQNRREQELLRYPELNSGFEPVYWYQDENITAIKDDQEGCYLESRRDVETLEREAGVEQPGEKRQIPLTFKIDVPRPGNYRVLVTVRVEEPMKDVLIFAGRRRLAYRGDVPAGHFTQNMIVNVCDIVPRGQTVSYEDRSIDITMVADRPFFTKISVKEINCPTVYIAGDSTVTDQSAEYPYAPGSSYSGWGQMLGAYLNHKIAVSNHAHSGLTTNSFREEGHYAIVEQNWRPGDYVLFQFGHNDQKLDELKAWEGYKDNLMRYISECRAKGCYPILVTPLARNTWKGNDGTYNDLLKEYADVCLVVGELAQAPVLDLHKRSMEFILEKGLEGAKPYFFPNDYTHSDDYGAYLMAGFIAEEIAQACSGRPEPAYRLLAECVTEGFGPWEAPKEIALPVKPEKYSHVSNPQAGEELLADVKELEKPASRADVLDMVIKTVRFFPTNVYNDMYVDVVGHEWYAGAVECAYQNGMIDERLVEDGHFYPEREVTLEEFLTFAMNGYQSRKPFPEGMAVCALEDGCADYARPYVRAAVAAGLLPDDGSVDLSKTLTRGEAVAFCRKMGI